MGRPYLKTYRICAAIIGLLAVLGIWLQFNAAVPLYISKGRSTAGAVIDFLSFFTIQSNLLVVVALFTMAVTPTRIENFFKKPVVVTAIAVYITIVSLVYNLVLRHLVHFTGVAKLGDELVHSIVPVLFVIYWLTAILKESITWKHTLSWLWYPLAYLIYILMRGAITGLYPYFFINVDKFGYPKVLFNAAVLMAAFLFISLVFVAAARVINRTNQAL